MINHGAEPEQREHAARMLTLPPLPAAFEGLWADFMTLDLRRPPVMAGTAPIPISEMIGYGQAMYGGYVPHEIQTLCALDALRCHGATKPKDDAEAVDAE